MKLVEILARELSEWPDSEGVSCIVQDHDTKLYAKYRGDDDGNPFFEGGEWMSVWHEKQVSFLIMPLATDHATAIVTREMWEAERARIKLEAEMESVGAKLTTSKITIDVDMSPLKEALSYFQDQIEAMNPITNRDRIRAIDVQLADLTAERAERIAELAAEGFALLPVVDAVEPTMDMEDWRNWRAGDLLEVVDSQGEYHSFNVGDVVTMLEHDTNLGRPAPYCKSNNGGYGWVRADKMKFHSRPKPC